MSTKRSFKWDGATGVYLVIDRAQDLPQPPAYIHSFAQSIPKQHQVMTNYFNDDPLVGPAWVCARKLWERSDFQPAEVPVHVFERGRVRLDGIVGRAG